MRSTITNVLLIPLIGCLFPLVPCADAAKREAFVVGTDKYDHFPERAQLDRAVSDARLVGEALKRAGFSVAMVEDKSVGELKVEFEAFLERAKTADCALFYFAGHAIEYHGENFLIGRNTPELEESSDVKATKRRLGDGDRTLPLQRVLDDMEHVGAVKVVILDACRDNPIEVKAEDGKTRALGGSGGLAAVAPPGGMLVAYSASTGQQANDGVFSPALARNLARPGFTLGEIFAVTGEEVAKASRKIAEEGRGVFQRPAEYRTLNLAGTRFVFVPEGGNPKEGPTEPASGPPLPPEVLGGVRGATKENPFENGRGMLFVPVELRDGKQVFFSKWETRVQDYAEFIRQNPKVEWLWKDAEFRGQKQGPDHPVVRVNWEEAQTFCEWLTKSERAAKRLGAGEKYRLPTDEEWSQAVGIGEKETAGGAPEEKSLAPALRDIYPWGVAWPPPNNVGNYADSALEKVSETNSTIDGFSDGFAFTAPVGSFEPNNFGIYDLGGNVAEWCEDPYSTEGGDRFFRGGSFQDSKSTIIRSSYRWREPPTGGDFFVGFRVVIEVAE